MRFVASHSTVKDAERKKYCFIYASIIIKHFVFVECKLGYSMDRTHVT